MGASIQKLTMVNIEGQNGPTRWVGLPFSNVVLMKTRLRSRKQHESQVFFVIIMIETFILKSGKTRCGIHFTHTDYPLIHITFYCLFRENLF